MAGKKGFSPNVYKYYKIDGEKEVIQGIILVAAAFAHLQKNDDEIALGIFGRALEKIGDFSGTYNNIDIDKIRRKITEMRQTKELTIFQI